jgi:hypothetical protein
MEKSNRERQVVQKKLFLQVRVGAGVLEKRVLSGAGLRIGGNAVTV